jgi:hypothetical protein
METTQLFRPALLNSDARKQRARPGHLELNSLKRIICVAGVENE